jgi:hypothetical protein
MSMLKEIIMKYKSISLDLIVTPIIPLLMSAWGVSLLFAHLNNSEVSISRAIIVLGVGFLGLAVTFLHPVCLVLSGNTALRIYSWFGLRSANYDLKTQLVSKEWDKSSTYLKLTFNDGKSFRLSKHSFFRLKKFSERF